MNKENVKELLLALIIGLALTLTSLLYARQTLLTENEYECKTCYYIRAPEVTEQGFPLIVTRTSDETGTTKIDAVGLLGDWLIYSALAYMPIQFCQRKTRKA